MHLVQNKTGNRGYAHLPEILLQHVILKHNGNYLFVCFILFCFTISLLHIGMVIIIKSRWGRGGSVQGQL